MKIYFSCIPGVKLIVFTVVAALCGCAPKTTVVLLPDPDGQVGQVTVKNDAGAVDITKARQATVIKGKESAPKTPEVLSEQQILADFSEALAALPQQPVHFVLYFRSGSNELTPESEGLLEKILQTIKDRGSKDISVFGHTDTAGDEQYNLHLSRDRAATVGEILVHLGVDSEFISTTSHGENNQLIKTPDNTNEPRNRRVEVVVK